MAIQLCGSLTGLLFCIIAFMCATNLSMFAPLLTIAFLGVFLTSSPLCKPPFLALPVFHLFHPCIVSPHQTLYIRLLAHSSHELPHTFAVRAKTVIQPAWLLGCCHLGQAHSWDVCADAVSMWAIPIPQRPAGQAMQIITMHLFGDVPWPPIIGAIQGKPKLTV